MVILHIPSSSNPQPSPTTAKTSLPITHSDCGKMSFKTLQITHQQQQQQQQGCLKSTGAEYRYAQYDNSKKKKNNHNDEDHETYDSDSSSGYGSDRSVCPFPTPTVSGSGNTTPDDEHSDAGAGEGAMLSENESTMISALANVLRTVTETNDLATRYSAKTATLFDCKIMPTFSLESYLCRIATHADCSLEAYILALYYMDTIVAKDGVIKITTRNAYKMLLASLLVAVKYLDDDHFSNADYALIGGVTTSEMNMLEMEVLRRLEWRMYVEPALFQRYEELLSNWCSTVQPTNNKNKKR